MMTKGDKRWIKRHTEKSLKELEEYYKNKGASMSTTKKVAAKRPAKKRPAKKAYRSDSIIGKLLQLKYRINEAYRAGFVHDTDETRHDKSWVMSLLNDIRNNGFESLSKEDGLKCNGLWRKYEGK